MWESLKKMIKTFKIEYGSRFEEGRELPWDPTSRLDLRHVLLSLFPLRSREQGMGLCAARSCPKASSIRLRKDRGGNAFRQSFLMESLSMALPRSAMGEGFHRVEDLFRSEVRRGVHGFDWGDYTEKAVKLIVSYSEGADFFQTFDLEERLRDNVPEGLVQKYAKALRGCYYRANALVFGGLEHTWHSQLENMRPYMTYVLGVTGNDLLRLGTWSICEIKCNSAFQYLVDVYFSLEEQAESEFLCSLCQADFPLKTLFRRADRHLVDLALSVKRVRKDFMSFYSEEVLRRRWIR